MNSHGMSGTRCGLELADGCSWSFAAEDPEADAILSRLRDAMEFREISTPSPHAGGVVRRLLVATGTDARKSISHPFHIPAPSGVDGFVRCVLHPFPNDTGSYIQLLRLSLVIARDAQSRGGLLLHGALAERDGVGVILAAPGGTGKTTASGRLPAPWRALCDDTTLVVRDSHGNYLGHPWPTWSRFLCEEGAGGRWDVRRAVPLGGIFFLSRAIEDRVETVGPGRGVTLLVHSAQQGAHLMSRGMAGEEARTLHLERFDNICALSKSVPVHLLHIGLTGPFWREIERVLEPS